ncbi:hypothetical protein VTK73DRAFT_2367 [Phialemonium thermophilum]|uniref:Zn(2)-C6 fungal-type domain-containing protein n=1 Tax=Phialemonium thermophilum TaxID=223376 RepID=A0ABR3X5G1_9PEZI
MSTPCENQLAPPHKRRRVKTGCLTCRARKVKCDESPNICVHCRSAQLTCEWPDGTRFEVCAGETRLESPARSKSHGRALACYNCRQARCKCSQTRPSCDRCLGNHLSCVYPSSFKRPRAYVPATPSSPVPTRLVPGHLSAQPHSGAPHQAEQPGSVTGPCEPHLALSEELLPSSGGRPNRVHLVDKRGELSVADGSKPDQDRTLNTVPIPTQELSERLVAAFFEHVHPYQANGYLHPASTVRAVRDGQLPQQVLFGLWAVAARFLEPPLPGRTALAWADEAGTRLLRSRNASRDNIITALLLLTHSQYSGFFDQHHLWCAVANRQALSLGLHQEAPADAAPRDPVEAERDRRLYHASYAFERQMSNGTPESVYCPAHRVRIRLPVDELDYKMSSIPQTPTAVLEGRESCGPPSLFHDVGIMGFYVRIMGARFMVKRCVQSMLENRDSPFVVAEQAPWEPTSEFVACIEKLAEIMDSLPARFRLTRGAILSRHDSPSLGPLVILYLLWNMCHLELYRILLPDYPESLPPEAFLSAPEGWVDGARQQCLRHAQAMTGILRLVADTMPRDPLTITDHTFPRFVYSSIRIQIEFAERHNVSDESRQDLKVAFAMMIEFVERMSVYFRPAQLLVSYAKCWKVASPILANLRSQCKAIKRMVRVRDMALRTDEPVEPYDETPPHPWFQKQKTIDEERQSAAVRNISRRALVYHLKQTLVANQAQTRPYHTFDFLDGIFSSSWPDGILSRDTPWMDAVSTLPSDMAEELPPRTYDWQGGHLSAPSGMPEGSLDPLLASYGLRALSTGSGGSSSIDHTQVRLLPLARAGGTSSIHTHANAATYLVPNPFFRRAGLLSTYVEDPS